MLKIVIKKYFCMISLDQRFLFKQIMKNEISIMACILHIFLNFMQYPWVTVRTFHYQPWLKSRYCTKNPFNLYDSSVLQSKIRAILFQLIKNLYVRKGKTSKLWEILAKAYKLNHIWIWSKYLLAVPSLRILVYIVGPRSP